MNRLHVVQLELISAILDGKDVLCCTATGGGKLAAFSVPSLVLLEYNKHLEAYVAGLPIQKRPIGVVVTQPRDWHIIQYTYLPLFVVLLMNFGLGSQAFKYTTVLVRCSHRLG